MGLRLRTGTELIAQGQWRKQGTGSVEEVGLLTMLTQLMQFRRRSLRVGALTRLGEDFRPDSWGGTVQYGGSPVHADLRMEKASRDDHVTVTAAVQLNTEWVWLHTYARLAGDYFSHRQGLRGAIGLGRAITFSAMHQENTLVDLRIFTDTNLNGLRDAGEGVRYDVEVSIRNQAARRRRNGVIRTRNLEPYAVYTVEIQAQTIQDPTLQPATGYVFSFTAEPGGLRTIDIPLQPLLMVTGQVIGWPGVQEVLEVNLSANGEDRTLPVYRDGGFFTQLRPGLYEVRLVNRISGETVMIALREVTPEAPSIILTYARGQE